MFKKITALTAVFALFASVSFAQTAPVATEDATDEVVAEEIVEAEAIEEDAVEAESTEVTAETVEETAIAEKIMPKAKTYFDGVTTFANEAVKFEIATTDNILEDKIFYNVDEKEKTEYTDAFSISEEGNHVVKYHSVDKIGNPEDENSFKVTIDKTAPVIKVIPSTPVVLVNDVYYTSKANCLTVTGEDNLSGFFRSQYSLNNSELSEYVTTFSFDINGDVELKIKSEDNVANATEEFFIELPTTDGSAKQEKVTAVKFFVDNTAPTTAISADQEFVVKDGKKVASKDFKFAIKGNDQESGVKEVLFRVDGKGVFTKYEKEIQFKTNGNHFIEAKTIDMVGNESEISILPVYVDIIPPTSTIGIVTE